MSAQDLDRYYDFDAKPITRERWVELWTLKQAARRGVPGGETSPGEDPTRVGSDHIGEAWVSTVWLGLDHSFTGTPPLVFETLIFGGEHDQYMRRYSTKDQARAGHDEIVTALRDGTDLP